MKWFAVPLLLIAACGGDDGGAPDAARDAVIADAAPDAPDAAPPACVTSTTPGAPACLECLVQPPLAADRSACTAAVCEVDPSCCAAAWDEPCTELADRLCDARCVNAITFGGFLSVTYARYVDGGFVGAGAELPDALYVPSIAWGDADRDGDADLIAAAECAVLAFDTGAWQGGVLELVPVPIGGEPVDDCSDLPDGGMGPRFYGNRARWYDVDRDGDLDAVFGGQRGAFVARQTGGTFTRDEEILDTEAVGPVIDVAVGDLDGDDLVDVVASIGPDGDILRWERGATGDWAQVAGWAPATTNQYGVELCDLSGGPERELILRSYNTIEAWTLPGGVVGTRLFRTDALSDHFACADLTGDGKAEIVSTGYDTLDNPGLPTRVLSSGGAIVWSSDVDLAPATRIDGWGIDAGDLDDDGDLDLVVAGNPAVDTAQKDIVVLWNQGGDDLAFTLEVVPDLLPNRDMRQASMTWLPAP